MTWLHFLNDCAEINKMLNASIKSLSTIHLAGPPPDMTGRIMRRETGLFQISRAPAPHDGADHSRVKQVLFQISPAPAPHDGADHSEEKQPAVFVLEMKTNHE